MTAISNLEVPNLLGWKFKDISKIFNLPLLKESNSYKNLNPFTSINFIYFMQLSLLKTKHPLK